MIYTGQHVVGGETVWVLLAQPNDDAEIDLSVAYETEVEEGRTGVQSRRPVRAAPLLAQSYDFIGGGDDRVQVRNFLGSIGEARVIVPLWCDRAQTVAGLFTTQLKVSWDSGYTNVEVHEGGSTPLGKDVVVGAILGTLKRDSVAYKAPTTQKVRIKVLEESAWAQRVDIAAAGPAAWDSSWNADWTSTPVESTRDRYDYEQIGTGRQRSRAGDSLTTWKQKAGFSMRRGVFNDFLGWFRKHRGGFAAFSMPSLFKPGADTPQAPHNFNGTGGRGYMRFGSDVLKLKLLTMDRVEFSVEFEQVLDTTTEERSAFSRLFEIYSDADPSDVARLTDCDEPVTAGGHTWTPARIELEKFRSSLKLENDSATIRCHTADIPQLAPIVRYETDIPVRCRIYHADRSTDPATTTVLTFGQGSKWSPEGPRLSFRIEPFNGLLKRNIPRLHFSKTCNYSLFDGGCRSVNSAAMDPDNWKLTGNFNAQWEGTKIRLVSLGTVPAGLADNWFRGGWVEIGSGIDKQVRLVTGSVWFPTGDDWADAYGTTALVHLVLHRPVRVDIAPVGSTAVVYAGCDGSYTTCKTKFSNGPAFGGAPFAPSYILSKPNSLTPAGK